MYAVAGSKLQTYNRGMSEGESEDEAEFEAIRKIAKILKELSQDARRRAINWLQDRFSNYGEFETEAWQTPFRGTPIIPPSDRIPKQEE